MKLELDVNHDGTMNRTFAGPDNTSQNSPFRFWVNNDNDSYNGEDYEASWRRDSDNNIIGYQRDLEDFARLWISGLPSLPSSNGYSASLSWRGTSGNPTIKLYLAYETDGGNLYLQDTNAAFGQVHYDNVSGVLSGPGASLGMISPGSGFTFPADYFLTFGRKHFLFEGVERGKGELVLTIQQNGETLAETSVFIELLDVKQMYERWTVGEVGSMEPTNAPYLATEGLPVGAGPFRYTYDSGFDANTPYILHVHGWNMKTWSKDSYAETGFKRLYWQGYTGRFGSFRWPTKFNFPGLGFDLQAFDLNNYDKSEWQAWKSAMGLRTLLTSLNAQYSNRVRVTAHSMGNVVAGEALRVPATNTPLAAVYAALEAAIPSHCHDATATNRELPWLAENFTPNAYANYWQTNSPSYFFGYQGADSYVNLFNTRDYALEKWEIDQDFKPADTLNYSYHYPTKKFYRASTELVFPSNTHEIFSFCVEARCYALGAQPGVGGPFETAIEVNLDTSPFNFGDQVIGHSAQFRFSNQNCWAFWDELLKTLELKPR